MPLRDKNEYNAYMKEYMLKRYFKVREKILKLLGNKCVICGSSEKLEIDHIEYKNKSFSIAKFHSLTDEKLLEEVKKCQLLCFKCHRRKTIEERGYNTREQHGTMACYRHGHCRCPECRKVWSDYCKEYSRRRKEQVK